MLSIRHTENLTGALISGDFWDLDEVKQAIHTVIDDEKKYYDWAGPRKRLLGVLYEIGHASKANRHLDFVDNGIHKDALKHHKIVASDKNIYYSVEILWPELIFSIIALNDFVRLYSKNHLFPSLDVHVATIRKFQSATGEALQSVMVKEDYDHFMKKLSNDDTHVQEYAIQFVDILNLNYISLTKEQRQKSLGKIALKLATPDKDYQVIREQVIKSANLSKSDIHNMSYKKEYPKDIEW